MGKSKRRAILEACEEIALPKLLILLSILAVFVPAALMTGVPRAMFVPLSLAVGFAMISSFLLSQTLVPIISNWLLKEGMYQHHKEEKEHAKINFFERIKMRFSGMLKKIIRKKREPILPQVQDPQMLKSFGAGHIGKHASHAAQFSQVWGILE